MHLAMQGSLWPTQAGVLGAREYREHAAKVWPAYLAKLREERIDAVLAEPLCHIYLPLAAWVVGQRQAGRTFVLGVNGAQGSGKSTLCEFLQLMLREVWGLRTAGFSIDDVYKTHGERERLGREVHPLLVTRGVPGTHDVDLALHTLNALSGSGPVALPSFDKARDDRRPPSDWPVVQAPVDVAIFEGWCVGSRPQEPADLLQPINELEQREDVDGAWRRHVNDCLHGEYGALFARLDRLIMLKVPSLECVYEWRSLQEEKLAAKMAAQGQHRLMDSSGLKRFIMHYERLTRHNLEEMPDRADLTLYLDELHQFTSVHIQP